MLLVEDKFLMSNRREIYRITIDDFDNFERDLPDWSVNKEEYQKYRKYICEKNDIILSNKINLLSNGILHSRGFILNSKDYNPTYPRWYNSAYRKFKFWAKVNFFYNQNTIEEYVAYSGSIIGFGYFHWLIDTLPRIILLKNSEFKDFPILLPQEKKEVDFIKSSLNLIGITNIIWTQNNVNYHCKKLITPVQSWDLLNYNPKNVLSLRSVILSSKIKKSNISKVYVSRRKASFRKIINEIEVIKLLERYGFKTICFEDYNWYDQISIMKSCEVLIGIHGAGLTNMMFMPFMGKVIEIFNENWTKEHLFCFFHLSNVLSHKYQVIKCRSANNQSDLNTDLFVDLINLENLL